MVLIFYASKRGTAQIVVIFDKVANPSDAEAVLLEDQRLAT
jgi:hypothetical protein